MANDPWADDPSFKAAPAGQAPPAGAPASNADDWKVWHQQDQGGGEAESQEPYGQYLKHIAGPQSAVDFAKGVGKGALSSMEGLGHVLSGGSGTFFGSTDPQVNTDASNMPQKVGKAVEGAVETVLPAAEGFDSLPSARRAGSAINAVEDAAKAKGVTVPLTRTEAPLQRVTELSQRGHSVPQVAGQLLTRSQAIAPMQFDEARDFYSALAKPSVWERMTTGGKARSALSKMKSGFNGDITDAAHSVGMGDQYQQAMNEYRNAMRLRKIGGTIGAGAVGLGAKAAGAGAVLGALKHIGGQ